MKKRNQFCQQKDVLERMNYLHQASHLIASKNRVAASYFGNNMIACGKKAVLRMEPDLKRITCKCCHGPLIPGETARVRLVSKPIKGVKWTCLTCMNAKMYPTRKGYKLWLEQPESVVETLDFTPKSKSESSQNPGGTRRRVKEQTESHPKDPANLIRFKNTDPSASGESQSVPSKSTSQN
ncbi:PREDICTED: ribonuclease P protein subunit p21 [Vollenhovia emeryi]|uniref:ribonuclease P protein subunit p21 n=1 Tax=Vollenhovia emeryi TaxID=411798 RepID=UPI0005F54938|nr:PREDICTED: ribonuclease P protein subunit p21 [Vollenhovia emeryi]